MLRAFFTIVYFLIFLFLIDLIFRNTFSVITNMLVVICWVIAFIASFGIADYTVKKIKEKYERK